MGFITTQISKITYKGNNYPCKIIINANGDEDILATETLIDAMGRNPDEWGDEERSVDEPICYYADATMFSLDDEELEERLIEIGLFIVKRDMKIKEMLEKIKQVVNEHNGQLEITSESNYPILEAESMLLDEDGVTRFYGKREEEYFCYNELADIEVEIVYDALKYNEYI